MPPLSLRRIAAGLFGLAVLLIVAGAVGLISARFGTYAIVLAVAVLAIGSGIHRYRPHSGHGVSGNPADDARWPAQRFRCRPGGRNTASVILYNSAEAEDMRPLIWLGVIYQAALLPGLLLNPYADNVQEWVHELFLVLGSLIVGWVVGRRGQAATRLNLYLFGCTVIGCLAPLPKGSTF